MNQKASSRFTRVAQTKTRPNGRKVRCPPTSIPPLGTSRERTNRTLSNENEHFERSPTGSTPSFTEFTSGSFGEQSNPCPDGTPNSTRPQISLGSRLRLFPLYCLLVGQDLNIDLRVMRLFGLSEGWTDIVRSGPDLAVYLGLCPSVGRWPGVTVWQVARAFMGFPLDAQAMDLDLFPVGHGVPGDACSGTALTSWRASLMASRASVSVMWTRWPSTNPWLGNRVRCRWSTTPLVWVAR